MTPAGVAQAPELAAIHAAAFDPAWSAAALAGLLASPGCFAFWRPGEGFLLARAVLDEAEIITLAVVPEHRRQGLAGRLLAATVAGCMARGVAHLHLEVATDNSAAQSFYSAAGFHQVGLRRGYYENGADARLLRLNLCAAQ